MINATALHSSLANMQEPAEPELGGFGTACCSSSYLSYAPEIGCEDRLC